MNKLPKPPKAFRDFTSRFPDLSKAWQLIAKGGQEGPLDSKTARLIKLGIAMGAMREGAVHSGVRKALAMGITQEEIEQVVALAAGTLGMPSCVALFSWTRDITEPAEAESEA